MGVHYVCDVPIGPQDDVGNHVTDALEPGDHSGDLRRLVVAGFYGRSEVALGPF